MSDTVFNPFKGNDVMGSSFNGKVSQAFYTFFGRKESYFFDSRYYNNYQNSDTDKLGLLDYAMGGLPCLLHFAAHGLWSGSDMIMKSGRDQNGRDELPMPLRITFALICWLPAKILAIALIAAYTALFVAKAVAATVLTFASLPFIAIAHAVTASQGGGRSASADTYRRAPAYDAPPARSSGGYDDAAAGLLLGALASGLTRRAF